MKYWRKPLDQDKVKPVHGRIILINERCKGCGFCVKFCPRNVLEESERVNAKGYHLVDAVKEDECVACGLCEAICPDFAIKVETVNEKEPTSV